MTPKNKDLIETRQQSKRQRKEKERENEKSEKERKSKKVFPHHYMYQTRLLFPKRKSIRKEIKL